MSLLEPKEIEIETAAGDMRVYLISKFPATKGREIIPEYTFSAIPKIGDLQRNQEAMYKLMAYAGVPREGQDPLMFKTQSLIDNHVPDWETLAKIEWAMLDYNVSFFRNGKASAFLDSVKTQAEGSISKMLMGLLAR
jgi:hypothetical protein